MAQNSSKTKSAWDWVRAAIELLALVLLLLGFVCSLFSLLGPLGRWSLYSGAALILFIFGLQIIESREQNGPTRFEKPIRGVASVATIVGFQLTNDLTGTWQSFARVLGLVGLGIILLGHHDYHWFSKAMLRLSHLRKR
ncbi:MAG TPA: hypothetical protein VGE04_04135 [Chloroflexia bacterium]